MNWLLELRLELYRQGIEFQDWKIWRIESEFERRAASTSMWSSKSGRWPAN